MPHKHHNIPIALLLTALTLMHTACSTTDETTITAPADTTPAPADTAPGDTTATPSDTPAPGDTTATPGSTPAPGDSTPAPGDSTPAPGDTPAPGGDNTAPTNTPATDIPSTESATSEPSRDQDPEEVSSVTFNYPGWLLTNENDSPTPLGRLCWAVQELIWMEGVLFAQVLEDKIPSYEVVFPEMSNTDNNLGPVGSVNEESEDLTIGTDDYFLSTLGAIQEPTIVATVNDDGLSEELQLFAQAFFSYVAALNEQIKVGGYENIDQATLPYQDFNDMPHVEEFTEAVENNSDKCKFPTVDDAEKEIAKFDQYVTEG